MGICSRRIKLLRALLLGSILARIKGFVPQKSQHWRQVRTHGIQFGHNRLRERPPVPASSRRVVVVLYESSSSNRGSRQNLSASELERREEERRRRERANDVVVGKTSAIEGAKDLEFDISATEEEWMRQASAREKKVFQLTERGLQMLSMLRLDEAVKAFDAVFDLKPEAYLWQAGIAKFYLGDLDEAAAIFSRCAEYYESRFLEPASEERIWRNACLLKKINGLSRKQIKQYIADGGNLDDLSPKPPDRVGEQLPAERRRVFRIASDLFASSLEKNYTKHIVARAQLQSIGGALDEHQPNNQQRQDQPRTLHLDRKMWKISSWFYLGLHYDVLGDIDESKKCMKRAILLAPNANGRDITHALPLLHMTARDWFDDEALDSEDEDDLSDYILPKVAVITDSRKKKTASKAPESTEKPLFSLSSLRSTIPVPDNVDPVVVESILFSLNKMRYVDLQAALKVRGLRAIGSKEVLQGRLFRSLLSDTGLMP